MVFVAVRMVPGNARRSQFQGRGVSRRPLRHRSTKSLYLGAGRFTSPTFEAAADRRRCEVAASRGPDRRERQAKKQPMRAGGGSSSKGRGL